MSDLRHTAKSIKKAAKARAKIQKKLSKAGDSAPMTRMDTVDSAAENGNRKPTPAERSAAAAERQVRLQRYRVFFALLMFLLAIATTLFTFKPWRDDDKFPPTSNPTAPIENGSP